MNKRPGNRLRTSRSRAGKVIFALMTVSALLVSMLTSTTAHAAACGVLNVEERLQVQASIASCNGAYVLINQQDGNLVFYRRADNAALWASGTSSASPGPLVMQGDGNLVLYTASGQPIFYTMTVGVANAYLAVQDDGNLVVYNGAGAPVWVRGDRSENTRPQDGTNCEPAFVVEDYSGVKGSLGMISAGHCDTPGKSASSLAGDKDFEIIPLNVNFLTAPTVLGGKELISANRFRGSWRNGDTFTDPNRLETVAPTKIGATSPAVCRFGGVSPTLCGNIIRDDYAPSYIPDSFGFYLLDIPCARGDSGSAVLSSDGTHAVGIVSGRRISDGACIVSRLDRVSPGMKLYRAPKLDASYELIFLNKGKWYGLSSGLTREQCLKLGRDLDAAKAEGKEMKVEEFRCVPM